MAEVAEADRGLCLCLPGWLAWPCSLRSAATFGCATHPWLAGFQADAETLRLVLRIDASKLMFSILLHGSELLQDQMSSSINGRGGRTAGPRADRVR